MKVAVHSDKPTACPILKDDKFIYFDALKSIEGCTNEIQKKQVVGRQGYTLQTKEKKNENLVGVLDFDTLF